MNKMSPQTKVKVTFLFRARFLYLIARMLVGGTLVYASISKLHSPLEFADKIAAYHLLPDRVINPLALGLPYFELACGLSLLTGFAIGTGAMGTILMLLVFTTATILAHLTGRVVDCGCFGEHSWLDTSFPIILTRNMLLLLLAFVVYRRSTVVSQHRALISKAGAVAS